MRPIVLILVIVAALSYLWGLGLPNDLFKDSTEYIALAENLSSDGTHYAGDLSAEKDYRLFNKRPPAYSVFLGLNSNRDFVLVRLLQALLLMLNFFIGLGILRSIRSGRLSLLVYSFLFAIGLPFILGVAFLMSDLFLCTEVSLFAYLVVRYFQTGEQTYLGRSALVFSLALLTKPVLFPLGILLGILYVILYFKGKGRVIVLSPLITLLAVLGLNYHYFGFTHYSSISAINASQYNAGLMDVDSLEIQSSIPHSSMEYQTYYESNTRIAGERIKENLPEYLRIHFLGMVKMMLDPGRFEIYTALGENDPEHSLTPMIYKGQWQELAKIMKAQPVALALFLFFFLLSMIKLIGLLLSILKIRRKEILFLWMILGYFLLITGPVGAFRFAIAFYVPALMLTAIGLSSLTDLFKKRPE